MKLVNKSEWREMSDRDRDVYVFTILGITPDQLDQIVKEFIQENGGKPNSIFVSWMTLAKIPVRIKHIKRPGAKLTVIPMESENGQFVLSLQDPHNWGNLFY